VGIVCVLIMLGSVSTALFVGILCMLILFVGGVKGSHLIKTIGLAGGALVLIFMLHLSFGVFPRMDTATSRIKRFFKSDEVSQSAMTAEQKQAKADETFQADMAKIAISSAPILGKGPGKSTQRYVLPHPYSDYIYTIIVEEYGILGGSFVLMLYLWFLYRCIMLMKTCKTVFSSITVGGLGLLITIQALLHILVNVGILPVTGHTLPLVSLGGTSLIILSCAFGIVLAVSRTKESSTGAAAQAGVQGAAPAEASAAAPVEGEGNSVAGGGNEQ
jgi:cell division protein FtsW